MIKGFILLVFFSFMLIQSEAQVFTKAFYDSSAGGGLNGLIIDPAGGYVFAGGNANVNYFIMKTTTAGQPVWIKQSLSSIGSLMSGIKTHDGGFAFTGQTNIDQYYWGAISFMKTDSSGMTQAVNDYWIDGQYSQKGIQLLQDASGNFYLLNNGGYNGNDLYGDCFSIIKLDSLGSFLNQKNYCWYLNSGEPWSFIRTADGGFIIVGNAYSGFFYKMFLMKTDSLLNVQWYKLFGNQTGFSDAAYIQQKANGHYLVVGSHLILLTTMSAVITEFTDTGSVVWSKDYEATGRMIRTSGFAQNSDGTITVGGTIDYNSPDRRVIIMNTDSIGNLDWSKLLLTSADAEEARDFKATPNGELIFCGVRVENGIQHPEFTKTDFDGNSKCGDSSLSLVVTNITLTEQSDSIEEVTTGFNSGDSRSFSQMNYDSLSDVCLATEIHEVKNTQSVTLFPDPASDIITILFPDQENVTRDVSIFDATGKLVRRFINVHSTSIKIPVAEIGSDGLYFCNVMVNDKQIFSGKFLIQR